MKTVSIEQYDNEYVVYTSDNPNYKKTVYKGDLFTCKSLVKLALSHGYNPIGLLAMEVAKQ